MTREQAIREAEVKREIPEVEKKLAALINRYRDIENREAANVAYQRKLLSKYRKEIQITTDHLANLKSEWRDFQDMRLSRA